MISKTELRKQGAIGDFFPFFGPLTALPPTYLFCDGRALPTTGTYQELYNAIQTRFGTGGAGTFRIPDSRGAALAYEGSPDDGYGAWLGSLGQVVGSQVATATLPPHDHAQDGTHSHPSWNETHSHSTGYTNGHLLSTYDTIKQATTAQTYYNANAGDSPASDGNLDGNTATVAAGAGYSDVSLGYVVDHTQGAGGAETHPNMMPWFAVPFIIKYTY